MVTRADLWGYFATMGLLHPTIEKSAYSAFWRVMSPLLPVYELSPRLARYRSKKPKNGLGKAHG